MTQTVSTSLLPSWSTFSEHFHDYPELGLSLDLSTAGIDTSDLKALQPRLEQALEAMRKLESGAIANPDEERMVGHYWLRAPELAPSIELSDSIEATVREIKEFASSVHMGRLTTPSGTRFDTLLSVGIGGSALGPQLVERALGRADGPMSVFFLDNTDPQGVDDLLDILGPERLATTLVLITSKSGGTPETLNGMLEMEAAFTHAGHHFPSHAVAITGDGSKLYRKAEEEGWLATFPMEDWVGGRTSVTSTVGLVPAALSGIDIDEFLRGAREMDAATRRTDPLKNPAALLAAAWYKIGDGRGKKDMVVLPYKDRLELFSRYLQQLVMESLGKALDRDGNRVEQGIAVYGNKGSTDQHAYVQQLRDGLRNFFVTFITVNTPREGLCFEVAEGERTADYLNAFFLGTRSALAEEGRPCLTLSVDRVSPYHLAALIALFERAVGLYAEMININAYHQPGVEAGKKAATDSLRLQKAILEALTTEPATADQIAEKLGAQKQADMVYMLCRHLSHTGRLKQSGNGAEATFRAVAHV